MSDYPDLELQALVSHLSWVLGTTSTLILRQQMLLTTELSLQSLDKPLLSCLFLFLVI